MSSSPNNVIDKVETQSLKTEVNTALEQKWDNIFDAELQRQHHKNESALIEKMLAFQKNKSNA